MLLTGCAQAQEVAGRPQAAEGCEVVLLDVRVPAAPADCHLGGRVFVHSYRLPAPRVTATATSDAQRSSAALTPGAEKQWLTVRPQDGFPLDVKTWTDEPLSAEPG